MTREEVLGAFLVGDLVKYMGVIGKILCVDDRDSTLRMECGNSWINWSDLVRVEDEEAAQIMEHRKQVRNACRSALDAAVPVILTKAANDRCVESAPRVGLQMVGALPDGRLLLIKRNESGELIGYSLDLTADDIELVES